MAPYDLPFIIRVLTLAFGILFFDVLDFIIFFFHLTKNDTNLIELTRIIMKGTMKMNRYLVAKKAVTVCSVQVEAHEDDPSADMLGSKLKTSGNENMNANNQITVQITTVRNFLCFFLKAFLVSMTSMHLSTLRALTVYTPTIIPVKSTTKNKRQPNSPIGQSFFNSLNITIGTL